MHLIYNIIFVTAFIIFKTTDVKALFSNKKTFSNIYNASLIEEIDEIFHIIKEGVRSNIYENENKNIVLILGLSESDKSNLAKLISGYDATLTSINVHNPDEFIIVDTNKSRTVENTHIIYPDLFINEREDLVIFDYPGFNDIKKDTEDIAIAYLIKDVIDHSQKIKIILTIQYSSVKPDSDSKYMIKLLEYTFNLVRDAYKYSPSMALVVTQIDDDLPDKNVTSKIIEFLKKFKQSITQLNISIEQQKFYEIFLDALLPENSRNHLKLGLLRKPNRAGLISDIITIQDEKKDIKQLIHQNIEYVTRTEGDFSYIISPTSLNLIDKIAMKIDVRIKDNILEISKNIQKHLQKGLDPDENLQQDFFSFKSSIDNATEKIDNLINILRELKRPTVFLSTFSAVLNDLQFYPKENIANMQRLVEYSIFLETVINKDLEIISKEWIDPLQELHKNIMETKTWFDFFSDLYSFLSSYEVQRNVKRYNVANMADWGVDRKIQGIAINHKNLRSFLDETQKPLNKEYNINVTNVDQRKLNYLNRILLLTLQHRVLYMNDDLEQLIVRGNFVKLSSIIGKIMHKNVKQLVIYVFNTVFIDSDIEKTSKNFLLTIIAPTWVICENRKIVLDGMSAVHRFQNAKPGITGLPGLPGGPAGHFLGIGQKFINEEGLTISTRGGTAGDAQNGGNATLVNGVYNGNGGDGGKAASGGLGGKLILIKTDNKRIKAHLDSRNGSNGKPGLGGYGRYGKAKDNFNSKWMQRQQKQIIQPNIPRIINDYKNYVRENLEDILKNHTLITFITELEIIPLIETSYTTVDFMYELENLENERKNKLKEIDTTPFYRSLSRRIEKYSRMPKEDETKSSDYKKILAYMYTATLSILSRLENYPTGNLIVDLENYLKLIITDMENFEKKLEADDLAKFRIKINEMFKQDIDLKIDEANILIKNQIENEINEIHKEINKHIETLLQEIKELSTRVKTENEQLKAKKRELQLAIGLKIFFGVLQTIGTILGIFGGVTAVVGAAISLVSTVATPFIPSSDSTIEHVNISIGVSHLLQKTQSDTQNLFKTGKLKILQNQLEGLSNNALENPHEWSEREKEIIKNTKSRIDLDGNESNYKSIKTQLYTGLKLRKNKVKRSTCQLQIYRPYEKHVMKRSIFKKITKEKALTYTQNALSVAEVGIDVYNKVKTDYNSLQEVKDAIGRTEEMLGNLKQFEERIYDTVKPMLASVQVDLEQLQNNLKSKTKVYLLVSKWHVQTFLRDLKLHVRQFTDGFQVQRDFLRGVEKLEEAMDTMISVYDQIQQYQENKQLADYIKDINSPSAKKEHIKDPMLKEKIDQLDKIIKNNEILHQLEIITNNLKQHVFPFASIYLKDICLPAALQYDDTLEVVSSTLDKIKKIKSKIIEYKATSPHINSYVHSTIFNSEKKTTQPFYVWSNKLYKKEISKFLSGEEVFLKADVTNTHKNAVKFKRIEIKFKSNQPEEQQKLDDILDHFRVEMTHLGNSHYKCKNKFFSISQAKQTISYTFEKNKNNEPVDINETYQKILKGDFSLSPYGMWSFKLIRNSASANYMELLQYKNRVDMELVGEGMYVSSEAPVCDDNLLKHYKEDLLMGISNVLDDENIIRAQRSICIDISIPNK